MSSQESRKKSMSKNISKWTCSNTKSPTWEAPKIVFLRRFFRFLAISHFLIEPVTSRLLNTPFLILYIGLAPLFPSHNFCCCSFWACWCLLQLMLKYVEMTLYSVFSVTWHSHSHKCRSSRWQQCATCFCGNLGDLSAGVNLLAPRQAQAQANM